MSEDRIRELELRKKLLELEEEEVADEQSYQQQDQADPELTMAEELIAYPVAATKGVTYGMDKYIGGAAEAARRLMSGEEIGSPVQDWAANRDRLIRSGGIGPQTAELTGAALSPVKLATNPIANVISQSALYSMTERPDAPISAGATGAAIGSIIPATVKVGKGAISALKYASEQLGVDTDTLAKAVASEFPLTTQSQRNVALENLNKSYIKTSEDVQSEIAKRKSGVGADIKSMFDYLDRVVGRKIPATEVSGYPREQVEAGKWAGINMRPLESGSMYGSGKQYGGLTRENATGMTMMDAAESAAERKTFFDKFSQNKNKFISNMRNASDKINFRTPQEKAEYVASLDNLMIDTDKVIEDELNRAMDGRVTQKTHDAIMSDVETKFYNRLDDIHKKYIQNITPSELRAFRDEVYNMLNYGKSKAKGTIGSQRVSLDITPQGGENQMFADELKAVGRQAKEKIEDYATYHGVPLADYNKQFNVLSDVEEVLPRPQELASVARSDELTGISMNVKNSIDSLRASGQNDLADLIENKVLGASEQRKVIQMADRSGGEITGIVRIPEQIMARGGNALYRNVYSPVAKQPIMKAIGKIDPNKIMPYASSAAMSDNGRKPQSIEEVALMKLPRSTEEAIQSPELLIEKVKMLDPNSVPVVMSAVNEDPEKLPDIMFALSQNFPHAFDSDKYGRFDGKIPAQTMMQFIGDLRDDKSISNTERAKHMNDALVKKQSHYTPQ